MPRKTPVQELVQEAVAPPSPRRSTRLSLSSPLPTKVVTRRNSYDTVAGRAKQGVKDEETPKEPAKTPRTRRAQSVELEADNVPKTPRTRRRSSSIEAESVEPVRRPRTRRSVSIEEELKKAEETPKKEKNDLNLSVIKEDSFSEVKTTPMKETAVVKEQPALSPVVKLEKLVIVEKNGCEEEETSNKEVAEITASMDTEETPKADKEPDEVNSDSEMSFTLQLSTSNPDKSEVQNGAQEAETSAGNESSQGAKTNGEVLPSQETSTALTQDDDLAPEQVEEMFVKLENGMKNIEDTSVKLDVSAHDNAIETVAEHSLKNEASVEDLNEVTPSPQKNTSTVQINEATTSPQKDSSTLQLKEPTSSPQKDDSTLQVNGADAIVIDISQDDEPMEEPELNTSVQNKSTSGRKSDVMVLDHAEPEVSLPETPADSTSDLELTGNTSLVLNKSITDLDKSIQDSELDKSVKDLDKSVKDSEKSSQDLELAKPASDVATTVIVEIEVDQKPEVSTQDPEPAKEVSETVQSSDEEQSLVFDLDEPEPVPQSVDVEESSELIHVQDSEEERVNEPEPVQNVSLQKQSVSFRESFSETDSIRKRMHEVVDMFCESMAGTSLNVSMKCVSDLDANSEDADCSRFEFLLTPDKPLVKAVTVGSKRRKIEEMPSPILKSSDESSAETILNSGDEAKGESTLETMFVDAINASDESDSDTPEEVSMFGDLLGSTFVDDNEDNSWVPVAEPSESEELTDSGDEDLSEELELVEKAEVLPGPRRGKAAKSGKVASPLVTVATKPQLKPASPGVAVGKKASTKAGASGLTVPVESKKKAKRQEVPSKQPKAKSPKNSKPVKNVEQVKTGGPPAKKTKDNSSKNQKSVVVREDKIFKIKATTSTLLQKPVSKIVIRPSASSNRDGAPFSFRTELLQKVMPNVSETGKKKKMYGKENKGSKKRFVPTQCSVSNEWHVSEFK